jgi:hypothetical protein
MPPHPGSALKSRYDRGRGIFSQGSVADNATLESSMTTRQRRRSSAAKDLFLINSKKKAFPKQPERPFEPSNEAFV